MDFCISGARSTFRTPPISIIESLCFLTTLDWLVTAGDGRHWNWCLGITGGHRCQGMLTGMSLPVTCTFRPNHSDVLQPENSTLFPFHLLHGILSVWTSLSSCHNLQDTIPLWLSSIPSQSMHIPFPWSLQSLPLEPHTFSSAMCGNIMVSLGNSSIEVPSSWWNSPGNSTGCSELSWQPPQPTTLREMDRWNWSTRNWNNISVFSPIKDRMCYGRH